VLCYPDKARVIATLHFPTMVNFRRAEALSHTIGFVSWTQMSQNSDANYARAIANGFRLPDYGPKYSWATSVLDAWAAGQPDELALHWVSHDGGRQIKRTYADVAERSHRAAHAFAKLGIKKGDRVMVQLPRILDWWDVIFGSVPALIPPPPQRWAAIC
jgi:non-ribosomal peptide synthetase component E (peptide arylation enzyme)